MRGGNNVIQSRIPFIINRDRTGTDYITINTVEPNVWYWQEGISLRKSLAESAFTIRTIWSNICSNCVTNHSLGYHKVLSYSQNNTKQSFGLLGNTH